MNTVVKKAYESEPIIEELRDYDTKDLRHAANYIDRENGKFPPINTLSLSKKLDALEASLFYSGNECGRIEFFLEEKGTNVTRHFSSIGELTTAISLGPIDFYWHGNLFIKFAEGVMPIEIKEEILDQHKLLVWIPKLKRTKEIFISGAEKVLCNNEAGLTAGQMKLSKGG